MRTQQGVVHLQEDKEKAVHEHFTDLLGIFKTRQETINWDRVNLTKHDLTHLEEPFTEQEVKDAIMELDSEKAPGPDGFILYREVLQMLLEHNKG